MIFLNLQLQTSQTILLPELHQMANLQATLRTLNSRAYPLFKAGHIQSIMVTHNNTLNSHIIRCTCLPKMKKDILYKIDLTLDNSGDIIQANCVCPAGTGPFGSCKHIQSALCYALEEYCRIKKVQPPRVLYFSATTMEPATQT